MISFILVKTLFKCNISLKTSYTHKDSRISEGNYEMPTVAIMTGKKSLSIKKELSNLSTGTSLSITFHRSGESASITKQLVFYPEDQQNRDKGPVAKSINTIKKIAKTIDFGGSKEELLEEIYTKREEWREK